MANFCSDCANLDTKDKKVDGVYKCKKLKEYVPANTLACDKFEKSYSRDWYEKEKLYDDGKEASNKWSGKEVSILVPIILIVLLIILKLLKVV